MALPVYWKPRPDLRQPFLIDISRAQRKAPPEEFTNWARFLAQKPLPRAVWVRDGISWGYTDPWYAYFRDCLADFGIPTAPYHVLYPGQPVAAQFDKMKRNVGHQLAGERAAMVDVELTLGQSRKVVTRDAGEFCDRLAQVTGSPAILYTRPYFMRDSMELDASWYDNVLYNMALYTFSGRERTPTDIYAVLKSMPGLHVPPERVVCVQTTRMGTGKAYGFQSNALDYDRWMKSEAELTAMWGIV